MIIDTKTGLLDTARFVESPNYDQRSDSCPVELIVIHNISLPPGQFGGDAVEALFTNQLDPDADPYFANIYQLKVSSHLFIRRDGEIVQFVPFQHRAWHAGVSCYQEKTACNDFSIGIELEGTDDIAYTDVQYAMLANVIEALLIAYPSLKRQRITGHSDIAPERKTDPGPAFDWQRLASLLEVTGFDKA